MSAERQPEAVFLATAEDASEAAIWKAILEGEGIPCWARDGSALTSLQEPMHFISYTIDIFVPASALDFARELLDIREDRKKHVRPPKEGTLWFTWMYAALIASGLAGGLALMLGLYD